MKLPMSERRIVLLHRLSGNNDMAVDMVKMNKGNGFTYRLKDIRWLEVAFAHYSMNGRSVLVLFLISLFSGVAWSYLVCRSVLVFHLKKESEEYVGKYFRRKIFSSKCHCQYKPKSRSTPFILPPSNQASASLMRSVCLSVSG